MGYAPRTRGKLDPSSDEPIHPFAAKYWAIIFALYFGSGVVRAIAPWFGATVHQHIGQGEWGYTIAFAAVLVFTTKIGKGSFARLASKRMWARTGTPMAFLAVLPVLLSLALVAVQTHGVDHIVRLRNLFSYDYHGTTYNYIPQYWFEDWLAPIMCSLMEIWVVILILSDSRQQRRDILLGSFLAIGLVLGIITHFTAQHFYPNAVFKFQVTSPSMMLWYIISGVNVITAWIVYRLLERGFRPSLLPVTAMMFCRRSIR